MASAIPSMNSYFAVPGLQSRRGPPQPLGENARFFPYSARTPTSKTHESGLHLRIKLSTPHANVPFRSDELIQGALIITRPGGTLDATHLNIHSLTLNVYFESRTLFWHFGRAQPRTDLDKVKAKYGPVASQPRELVIAHEVHRGMVPHDNIQFSWKDGRSISIYFDDDDGDGTPQVSFPFAFQVPMRMRVDECNDYPGAPRNLCRSKRPPPPSLPDSAVASVQWVVEAVLRLHTDDGPEKVTLDERLFKLSNESALVGRLVFPLLPADTHMQDLSTAKFFGDNLNLDPFGSAICWEGKADTSNLFKGKGGEWRTYRRIIKLNSGKVMSTEADVIVEFSLPKPAIFQRSAPNLPFVVTIRFETAAPVPKGFLTKRTLKEICINRATISLLRQTSTRGGKEVDAHTNIETVRTEVLFPGVGGEKPMSSYAGKSALSVKANSDTVVWEIEFDMQSENLVSEGRSLAMKENLKAGRLVPSFRTPNVQVEYLITLTLSIDGHGDFPIVRLPIQLLAGDSSELPSFAEATSAIGKHNRCVTPPAYGTD